MRVLQQIIDMEHLKAVFTEKRAGDIRHCSSDISKAQKLIGFCPRIQLEDGLSKLVKWYLNSNLNSMHVTV